MSIFTGKKAKGLKIFENDIVTFDIQKTTGTVKKINEQWIILSPKGQKWDLEDSILEGITIQTSFM